MKTKTLTTALLFVLIAFANLNAKSETLVLENHFSTISTVTTEIVKIDTKTQKPNQKNVYKKNTDNKLMCKKVYKWKDSEGWVPSRRYEYSYTESGVLAKMNYCEWSKKDRNWAEKGTNRY